MIQINCELCGKVGNNLSKTLIEGVELNVCRDCSNFGKVLNTSRNDIPKKKLVEAQTQDEKIHLLSENYNEIIKKRRESLGLTQKDFAKKINEKESILHKIETGTFEPSLSLAKKLEKFLGIKLIEDYLEEHEKPKSKKEKGFTLGDFIKVK